MNWSLFVGTLLLIVQIYSQITLCNYEHSQYVTHPTTQLCQFVYGMNRDCKELNFRFCRFKGKCLSNLTGNCSQYQINNSESYSDCLEKCCPVFESEAIQLYTLIKCGSQPTTAFSSTLLKSTDLKFQSYPQTGQMDLKAIRVMIVIAVILVVLMVFVILKCIDKYRQNRQNQLNIRVIPLSQRRLNPIIKNTDKIINKQWERLPIRIILPQQNPELKDVCAICLNQYSNATLDCGHQFHKECIYLWLSRNYSCPLCKSRTIKNIELKCSKCLNYEYHCKTTQLKNSMQTQDICNYCRKYEIK